MVDFILPPFLRSKFFRIHFFECFYFPGRGGFVVRVLFQFYNYFEGKLMATEVNPVFPQLFIGVVAVLWLGFVPVPDGAGDRAATYPAFAIHVVFNSENTCCGFKLFLSFFQFFFIAGGVVVPD